MMFINWESQDPNSREKYEFKMWILELILRWTRMNVIGY